MLSKKSKFQSNTYEMILFLCKGRKENYINVCTPAWWAWRQTEMLPSSCYLVASGVGMKCWEKWIICCHFPYSCSFFDLLQLTHTTFIIEHNPVTTSLCTSQTNKKSHFNTLGWSPQEAWGVRRGWRECRFRLCAGKERAYLSASDMGDFICINF